MPQLPQISPEMALLAGRAVFLVFCFLLAAITFTRWRRTTDRAAERFHSLLVLPALAIADIEEH